MLTKIYSRCFKECLFTDESMLIRESIVHFHNVHVKAELPALLEARFQDKFSNNV